MRTAYASQKWDRFGNLLVDVFVAALLVSSAAVYAWWASGVQQCGSLADSAELHGPSRYASRGPHRFLVKHAAAFSANQHYDVYDNILAVSLCVLNAWRLES
jgi:hypothetical protein